MFMAHFIAVQRVEFPQGFLVEPPVFNGELPGQAHLTEPQILIHVGAAHIAGIPVLHPADHDPASVRCEHALGCVEINTVVDGLVIFLCKGVRFPIVTADQAEGTVAVVVLEALGKHILGAGEQYLFAVQRKEVGAFPHFSETMVILYEYFFEVPVKSVVALIEQDLSGVILRQIAEYAEIGAVLLFPEFWVPKMIFTGSPGKFLGVDYRVAFVFFEIYAVAHGQTLGLDIAGTAVI